MTMELRDYYNIGIGDKVKLVSREKMQSSFNDYVDDCGEYEHQIVTISDMYDSHFYIRENNGYNFFGVECIEEVVERNAETREMTSGVFRYLQRGDKILLRNSRDIASSWSGSHQMAGYGGCIVTVKDVGYNELNIVEDRQNYRWHRDLIEAKVLKYKEPTEEEKQEALKIDEYVHEITINSSNLYNCERLNQLELVKVTDDVDEIIRNYNTRRFAEYLAGKWIIVSKYNNRVYLSLNPHIAKGLTFLKCPDWKLDNYYNFVRNRQLLDSQSIHRKLIKVNFETGELINVALEDPTRCCICGTKLESVTHYGRYCRDCLTGTNGFAYRFGYHGYNDGYPTPDGVNTKKTPVFGCEIERDYVSRANNFYESFSSACSTAMIDIIKETQGEQLKNGTLKREQVFMSDGSLNSGGIEWITFPHTFDWYIENKDKLDKAIQAIKIRGFKDTSKAGNHIHINRDFFTNSKGKCTAKYCAAKMAVLFNKYWEVFCAIAKRTNTRYTTKPTQEYDDDLFTIVEKTIQNQHNHGVAVNLQHDDTIEIRLWSAIRGADDLLFFLDNMQALAQYTKKNGLERVQTAKVTDFMKYYKLKTSIGVVKSRLRRKPLLKRYYDEVVEFENKQKENKGGNK